MYKYLANDVRTGEPATAVLRVDDGSFIPFDQANSDYQAYLKWISEGNSPLPADEPTES
jgi:hypothetical protein